MRDKTIREGSRVRVSGRHWLRPHGSGTVVRVDPERGEFMFWIEFDVEGKGIEGKFLYLDKYSFEVLDEPARSNKPVSNAA